ncbi:MAG: hypothetical protein IT385_21800 [Deltaproteobacteria bacterium]|nr:hypothetical protein [Deltaproteobacteria bacterium]
MSAAIVVAIGACAPEPSAREVFASRVVPVLERRCGATTCHGVSPDAEDRGEVIPWVEGLFFEVDAAGHLHDPDAAREAAVRSLGGDADPAFAPLIRKPLPAAFGGERHAGGDQLSSPEDPAYRALYDWAAMELAGVVEPPLDANERRFADEIEPALLAAGCGTANCHGPEAAVPFNLDGGVEGRRSTAITRGNYAQAVTMLALDGAPERSRLLVKALPLHAGGIAHKGGNTTFLRDRDDTRARAIEAWACAERLARVGAACAAPGEPTVRGLVFVRGPLEAGDAFGLDVWEPGTRILRADIVDASLTPGAIDDLTTGLADAPTDARDPALEPSGRRLAFAWRRGPDVGHHLFTLDLDGGEVEQLTFPDAAARAPVHDRDPTFGPDGRVWFVSDRSGLAADDGRRRDADLYELDPATGALARRTFTPHIERRPVFLTLGHEHAGEVAFTALREAIPGQRRAHPFRFPPSLETEYHQHFGITPPEDLFFDLRELADGRYVAVVGALDGEAARWSAGGLGVIERNFGPELPPGTPRAQASLPGYLPPLSRLEAPGVFRDPVGLPDGRVLASRMDTPGGDLAIVVLTLDEARDGAGATVSAMTTLVDAPAIADYDPEPIVTRGPIPGHARVDPPESETHGRLLHQGLPIIDALLANLSPTGPKPTRADITFARLVEALPRTPEQRATDGLGPLAPARILAELPVAADGSFQADVPAGVPFRIQALDADRMAVGVMHNRWLHVEPGQTLSQGIATASLYTTRCAACHGALDGRAEHALVAPDLVTSASITLGRYADRDPRRPLTALRTGDDTRISVDFRRDVRPILDRRCATAGCHAGATPAAGLDLGATPRGAFDAGYQALVPAWVDAAEGRARTSPLMERVLGRELDAPGAAPAHPHGELDAAERLTLVRWIDLGASWSGGEVAP